MTNKALKRRPSKVVATVLMFLALLVAFIAERFIRSCRDEKDEDRVTARIDSIEARLERLELRS